MTEIYIVEYHYQSYEDYMIHPIKAFRDKQKAEEFVKDCEAECLRINIEVENYWFEHKKEYDRLRAVIREKVIKKKFSLDTPEGKRSAKIMEGKRNIIKSHKYHPNYPGHEGGDFSYEITPLELEE